MRSTLARPFAAMARQTAQTRPVAATQGGPSRTERSPGSSPPTEPLKQAPLDQLEKHVEHLEHHYIGDEPSSLGDGKKAWSISQASKLARSIARRARTIEATDSKEAALPVWALKHRAERGLALVRIRESNALSDESATLIREVMSHHAALKRERRET